MYKCILVGICLMIGAQNVRSQSNVIADVLESNIQSRIDNGDIVGIIVGTIEGDNVSYDASGVTSLTTKEAIDKHSIFEIGSISKTFTGLMLADMVLQGKMKLDDDIQNYMPEGISAPRNDGKFMQLAQLSNHTSGFPRMPSNFAPKDYLNLFADYTEEMMYDFVHNYTPTRDIGSAYEYSNLAVGLLGDILARHNDQSYESLLRTAILDPLNMKQSGITDVQGTLAKGHMAGKEMSNWDFGALEGAGAIRSTTSDMMQYLKANMGLVESNLYPAMQLAHKNSRSEDSNPMVGLGWFTMVYDGQEIIWHNGATGGYTSFIGWIKGTNKGVVVLNNSTENVDDIGFNALVSSYPLKKIKKTIKVEDAILDSYVGKYALAPTFILTVTKVDDLLNVKATGQESIPVYAESETKFYYKVVDAQLVFKKDETGKVESVTLFQNGQEMPAKRME